MKCVTPSTKDFTFTFHINESLKMFIHFTKKYFSLFVTATSKVKKKQYMYTSIASLVTHIKRKASKQLTQQIESHFFKSEGYPRLIL